MSDDLVKRLRNTPNWMREEYAHYKDGLKVFDRAPFEAAYALEAQAARIAELEAAQGRLILSFRLNLLRLNPRLSHETISRAIEVALTGGKDE